MDYNKLRICRYKHRIRLTDIARELGYNPSNLGAFEKGENNNARILYYYLRHVLTDAEVLEFVKGGVEDEDK